MSNSNIEKILKLQIPNFNIAKEKNIKKKNYFLKIAIPLALLYWLLDSLIHYFWYGELEFEIIPSGTNELWMRSSIFVLLAAFGLFADNQSRKSIKNTIIKSRTDNIARAKKHWELAVDLLPQLVITLDHNAKITRVNRTIEAWGIGRVDNVDGLYLSDFLKSLTDIQADDTWISGWPRIWKKIKNEEMVEWKVDENHLGKTFQYTLKKISDYDPEKDQCYAVLVIDDITTRQHIEKTLRKHALNLEKKVSERTLELKQANEQLKQKLEAQKIVEKALQELQQCRLNLLRDLITAQENERKRIACELHDSIGQSLGATKFRLEEFLINKKNSFDDIEYDQLNELVVTIKNTINEVRNIAMDLRPAMLDDLGALATLQWFCREFENTYTGTKVKLLIDVNESDISDDKKVVIFRIVQEAMNNIAKHGNATNIILELNNTDSGLRMFIRDNGCGFDIDRLKIKNKLGKDIKSPKCSFGLNSMRERAESTNGKLEIESAPCSGTSVIVTWGNNEAAPFIHS
ncbi:MAG: ATP-binding protein [Gammaproteobacteria bacterium]